MTDTIDTACINRPLPRGGSCTIPVHGWVWPHEVTGMFGFTILEGIEPVGSFGWDLFDTAEEAFAAMFAALVSMGA